EDGIRDATVTGVQTCALPILARVRAYHERQVEAGLTVRTPGAKLRMRVVPLDRVGIYVPGGKAAYPSTVIMNAVPAAVAGVGDEIGRASCRERRGVWGVVGGV